MASDIYSARFQPLDVNGKPYPGAQRFCLAGGGSWPTNAQAVYSDIGCTIPLSNPVIADASGRFPVCYLSGGYKFIFQDAANNMLWTDDNIIGSISSPYGSSTTFAGTSNNISSAISGVNNASGTGVSAVNNASGIALTATAGASSPTHAPFRNVPVQNIPVFPSAGEQITAPSTNKLQTYDGSSWCRVVNQYYTHPFPGGEQSLVGYCTAGRGNDTVWGSTANIPANSLTVGSRIKVAGYFTIGTIVGSPHVSIMVCLGTGAQYILAGLGGAGTQFTNGDCCSFSVDAIVSAIGTSATIVSSGYVVGPSVDVSSSAGNCSPNTQIANIITFEALNSGVASSINISLWNFSVEIT